MEEKTKYGDTLVCCVNCGVVFAGHVVATGSSAEVLPTLGAGKDFRGKPCPACRQNAHWSMYRVLTGPLRVPRPEGDGAAGPAAKPIWACRVCDFVSRDPVQVAEHRNKYQHPMKPAPEGTADRAVEAAPAAAMSAAPTRVTEPVPAPPTADGD